MFVHRMALELHMLVSDIRARMSVSELLDWVSYFDAVGGKGQGQDAGMSFENMTPEQIAAAMGAKVQG